MKINENFGWKGTLKIITSNYIRVIKNRLMNNALDEIIKALYSDTNMQLKHIAIGDDDTANIDTLTTLYNEIYRVPVLSKLRTGTGEITSRAVLQDVQPEALSGICTIKEIGFFCGDNSYNWNGGSGKDTGLMISRIILSPSESKIATEQIEFSRTDEFTRG
jgi:hypothetical protein